MSLGERLKYLSQRSFWELCESASKIFRLVLSARAPSIFCVSFVWGRKIWTMSMVNWIHAMWSNFSLLMRHVILYRVVCVLFLLVDFWCASMLRTVEKRNITISRKNTVVVNELFKFTVKPTNKLKRIVIRLWEGEYMFESAWSTWAESLCKTQCHGNKWFSGAETDSEET